MRCAVRGAFLVTALTCRFAWAQPQEPVQADAASERIAEASARAQAFMEEGIRHFEKENWREARVSFLKAWALLKHHTIAASLAEVELKLGLYPEAAEHLRFVLAETPSSKSETIEIARNQLDQCKEHVAVIGVSVNQPGATVRVNGRAVGVSPLEAEVFVDPGEVVVTAELAGFERATRSFRVDAGVHSTISLVLTKRVPDAGVARPILPKTVARAEVAQERDQDRGPSARTWALLSGAGLTLAAAGIGVGYALRFYALGDDAETLREQANRAGNPALAASDSQCWPPPGIRPEVCSDLEKKVEKQYAAGTVAVVALGSAIVLGGATLATYFVWNDSDVVEKRPQARAPRIQIAPQIGQGVRGVLVRTTF